MSDQSVSFLGLAFEPKPVDAAVSHIVSLADTGGAFSYVVTPNVDHMVRLNADETLRPLYDEAALILNDSRILETLARRDDLALPASPGADLVANLFADEIKSGEPVTIIGSTPEDVAKLEETFGLQSIRHHDAPIGLRNKPDAINAAAAFMAEHPARFHFLCVGSPQQELVALAAKQRGDVAGIGLCCGASLDFLSGRTARAPEWMRNARLEWLHRMGSEPGRLIKRYVVDGPKILKIWQNWRNARA